MIVFEYIGENIERIKQDVKIGITSFCILNSWAVYSRYLHYRSREKQKTLCVLFTAQDFKLGERHVYKIIQKMEAEV
jgi:hypothetical protein